MNSTSTAIVLISVLYISIGILVYRNIKTYDVYVDMISGEYVKVIEKKFTNITIAHQNSDPETISLVEFLSKYSRT